MLGIRTAFRNCFENGQISCRYAVMRLEQRLRKPQAGRREILFFLGGDTLDFDDGRNAYLALSLFDEAGYNVYLYPKKYMDLPSYRAMGYCAQRALDMKSVKLLDRLPDGTGTMCLATDGPDIGDEVPKRSWKRWVFLNFLKSSKLNLGEAVQMPYSMHPRIHSDGSRADLGRWRRNKRTMRLFFVGNTSEVYYDSPAIRQQGALSRLEALRALKGHPGPLERITDAGAFEKRMKDPRYFSGGVLVETGFFRIAPSRWLETLSRSDFFLCLSGTDYPMCHNAIEAMAVGSVPVTGYADWFDPPLEHGKNAVIFSGTEDLKEKVKSVLEMPEEKIAEMRRNAADYYDRHLSAKSFIRRFEAMPEAPGTLILFPMYRAEATAQELASSKELKAHLAGQKHAE